MPLYLLNDGSWLCQSFHPAVLAHWRRWAGWLNDLILWPTVAARATPLN